MQVAEQIREAVSVVATLRAAQKSLPGLGFAVQQVKRIQSRRFEHVYSDLLAGGQYAGASRFFLSELYSDLDYRERDLQYSRIAGAIESLFPQKVAQTALALARLHQLTEELDHGMATFWEHTETPRLRSAGQYLMAWRLTSRRAEREAQLRAVLEIGRQMSHLTRTPGLRTMLKMMRVPASAAGLATLQKFLEDGFDTFALMARERGGVEAFLKVIQERETDFMANMFDSEPVACETWLADALGELP